MRGGVRVGVGGGVCLGDPIPRILGDHLEGHRLTAFAAQLAGPDGRFTTGRSSGRFASGRSSGRFDVADGVMMVADPGLVDPEAMDPDSESTTTGGGYYYHSGGSIHPRGGGAAAAWLLRPR
jgi:hypothetical protein